MASEETRSRKTGIDLGDIKEAAPPVERLSDLAAHLESGCKAKAAWRIGTEHEKIPFYRDSNSPVPYDGPRGIRALLQGLSDKYGWRPVLENGAIIALQDGAASITLEPGGQFELSGAPLEQVHQTCGEVSDHLKQLRDVAGPLGIAFLGLGFSPQWSLEDTPIMPKQRYGIMRAYMAKVGRLGRQMMFRSCTVQANLDFGSEADMRKKMRVALALQPIATALFANSPFAEGRPNGHLSYRGHVWTDTDPDRTGMLPFVFEDGFGFEKYADYALDVPMYFVKRGERYLDVSGRSFREFFVRGLPELPGERPTMKDWEDHLTTLFPEVRLKTFIEVRGADSGPWSRLCALPAFWAGLLYSEDSLDAAWDLVKGWNAEDRESLHRAVPALGLKAPIRNTTALDVARAALAIARKGLVQRGRLNGSGDDETGFLAELEDIAATGITPAERLLERWRTEWRGDMNRLFESCAY